MEDLKGTIRLVTSTSPLEGRRKIHDLSFKNQSVLELLQETKYERAFTENPDYSAVYINDKLISNDALGATYPNDGDIVTAKLIPGATVTTAIIAIATAISAAAGTIATIAGVAVLGTTVGAIVAGIINIGLLVGASILASSVFAPKLDDLSQVGAGSSALLLTGGRNKADLFGVVPKIYGEWRFTPPLAARANTEVVGTDQYLRQAFLWGLGDYEISDIRVGNTPYSSYVDAIIETKKLSADPLTLPDAPTETQIQNALITLNGTDEILRKNTNVDVGIANEWTVMFWMKPGRLTSTEMLVDISRGTEVLTPVIVAPFTDFSDIKISVLGGQSGNPIDVTLQTVDLGGISIQLRRQQWSNIFDTAFDEWVQVIVTWEGSLNRLSLWRNGILQPTTFSEGLNPAPNSRQQNDTRKVAVGGTVRGTHQYQGSIQQVAIWDVALDSAEVVAIYNSGAADRTDLSADLINYFARPNLKHWWRFCLDTADIGRDYGQTTATPIDLMDDQLGIDISNCTTESVTIPAEDTSQLDLFPQAVKDDQVGIQLRDVSGGSNVVIRSTAAGTIGFSLSIFYPNGLWALGEGGKWRWHQHTLEMAYRRVGDPDFIIFKSQYFLMGSAEPFWQFGSVTNVPPDTYEVRVRLLDAYNGDPRGYTIDRGGNSSQRSHIGSDPNVISLKSFAEGSPFNCPNATITAIRIKATEQLSGQIDEFNGIVRSLIPRWSATKGFSAPVFTRNPAWICLDILRGEATGRPIPEANIDLPAFKEWADFCETEGFEFDGIFDFKDNSVFNAFNTVSLAGRASLTLNGDLWSVVVDDPAFRTAPVQMFTARNSRDFQSTKVYPDTVHLVKAPFPNRDKNFVLDIAEVFNDGFTADNATNIIESQEMRGLTTFASVFKAVRFDMLRTRFRPEVYQLIASLDALVARRGDKVRVNHHLLVIGLGTGRVTDVTLDAQGNISSVKIDEPQTFEIQQTYSAEFRHAEDGSFVDIGLVNPAIGPDVETDVLTFVNPVQADAIACEDLCAFGIAEVVSADMVVTHIENKANLTARITMVDEAPEIQQTLNNQTVPAFESQIKTSKRHTLVPPPTPVILQTRKTLTGFSSADELPLVAIKVDVQPGQGAQPGFNSQTIGYFGQWRENDPRNSGFEPDDAIDSALDNFESEDSQLKVQQVSTAINSVFVVPAGALRSVLIQDPQDLSAPAVGEFYFHSQFTALGIADTWTISTWCRPGDLTTTQGLWSVGNVLARALQQGGASPGRFFAEVATTTGTIIKQFTWDGVFATDVWVHLVLTWDGVDLVLYKDGVVDVPDVKIIDGAGAMGDVGAQNWYGSNVGSSNFVGHLGHHAWWNTVLDSAAIAQIHDPGNGPPFAIDLRINQFGYLSSASLQHYWRPGFTLTEEEFAPFGIVPGIRDWGPPNTPADDPLLRHFFGTDFPGPSIKQEAPL